MTKQKFIKACVILLALISSVSLVIVLPVFFPAFVLGVSLLSIACMPFIYYGVFTLVNTPYNFACIAAGLFVEFNWTVEPTVGVIASVTVTALTIGLDLRKGKTYSDLFKMLNDV